MGDIGKYFSRSEFACRCGCGRAHVEPALVQALDCLRGDLGRPVAITSGYRCADHNRSVGGRVNSAHTRGMAADIGVGSSDYRYDMLDTIFRAGLFGRVGIAKEFVHVDVDKGKPQRVVWIY